MERPTNSDSDSDSDSNDIYPRLRADQVPRPIVDAG
jgi:hypothetical protein